MRHVPGTRMSITLTRTLWKSIPYLSILQARSRNRLSHSAGSRPLQSNSKVTYYNYTGDSLPVSLVQLLHFGSQLWGLVLQEGEVIKVTRDVVLGVVISKLSLDHIARENAVRLVRTHQLLVDEVFLEL